MTCLRRIVFRLCSVPAALVALAAGAAAQPAADAPAELRRLEQALADTLRTRDRAAMERLLADDFVLRSTPDVPRDAWIANALKLCWGDTAEISDFQPRVLDGAAIVSFVLTLGVNPDTCQPAVIRSLVTDVWTREAGGWRLRVRHTGPPPGGGIASQYGLVPETPPAWTLDAELSLLATAGNTDTRTLGLGSTFARKVDTSSTRLAVAFVSSEVDDVTRARALSAEGRHGRRVWPQAEVFGRASYARDRFAGIEGRSTLEGGVGYTPALPQRHTLAVEASSGFTWENRLFTGDLQYALASGTVSYAWKVTPGAELKNDLALNADLTDGRNWRGTNAFAATVAINRVLSLRFTQAVEYRNLPVPGFKRTDMRAAAALVVAYAHRPD